MKKSPSIFTRENPTVHRRMTDTLRAEISNGKFVSGTQLPSTRELAESWQTSIFTVHTALKTLVHEGWIDRRKGAGTYIANRQASLRTVGIYHDTDISSEIQTSFSRNLHFSLLRAFERMKVAVRVFIDTRPVTEQTKVLPALANAVSHRHIQGLIVPRINATNSASLARFPLPAAFLGSGPKSNVVSFDITQFFHECAQRLASQGGRKIGIISNVEEMDTAFYGTFAEAAGRSGLVSSPKWMRSGRADCDNLERHGYVEFQALWKMRQRPDALVVYPDSVARGVVLGALQHGAGRRMKFAFHRNSQASFLCPFSATYGISDEDSTALALIDIVQKQVEGKKFSRVLLPYQFIDEKCVF